MKRAPRIVGAVLLVACSAGCVGGIRDTTTPRTSTDMLLISSAAERAVKEYDASELSGKRVFIDHSKFDSVDKNYVISALRHHLAKATVTLADAGDAANADVVMQVRNATLGIWDGDFTLGIPQLKVSSEGFGSTPFFLPPLYAFRRLSAQGFAKLQLWLSDPKTSTFVGRSGDLWGHSYYNQWWFFGIGPFDGSNDIYPEIDFNQWVPGSEEGEG